MASTRKRGWGPAAAGGAIAGIALTVAVVSISGGSKPPAEEERWRIMCDPANPCPGTTPALMERCSCEPSALAYRNAMCFLDRHMRQEVSQCMGGSVLMAQLDAGTRACVETHVQSDPEAKLLFQQATEKAAAMAGTLTKAWNDCYRCWSSGRPPGCPPEASP